MPRTFSRFASLPLLLAPSVAAVGRSLLTQRMRIGYEQASLDVHESNSTLEIKHPPHWCDTIFLPTYTHKFGLQRNGAWKAIQRYIQLFPSKKAARQKPELYVWPSSYADGGDFEQQHCRPNDFRYRVSFDPLEDITIKKSAKAGMIWNDDGQVVFHGTPNPNSGDINHERVKKDGTTFQAVDNEKIAIDQSITSITVNVPYGNMWKQMRRCILHLQSEYALVDNKAMKFVIRHFRKSPTSFTKDNLFEMILFMVTEGLLQTYESFTGFLRPILDAIVASKFQNENLAFLDAVVDLDKSADAHEYKTKALKIYAKFIVENAPELINIPAKQREKIENNPQYGLKGKTVADLPDDLHTQNVFKRAKSEISNNIFRIGILASFRIVATKYANKSGDDQSNQAKARGAIAKAMKAVFDTFQGGPASVSPEMMIKHLDSEDALRLPAKMWKDLAKKLVISMEAKINAS